MDAAQIALSVHFANACSTIAAVGKALHVTAYTADELAALQREIWAAQAALARLDSFINLHRKSQAAELRLRLEAE